ncbi:MAG: histidine kinase [Gammaproteobacteria bacterium]|nr:histidine kinase [Gammaproteobacteria bacterium]MBU1556702.1 histidine kinase [Gammaproteobacteria bacterium]MBU2071181.1 histidine kinase [Gammaproteobacteria bacterium]MBU2184369.1 histidine kinase [Gammaproteobacteria bacterium]MBU2206249.1 histidine kinase [Gammaproteobacteria bacterium]
MTAPLAPQRLSNFWYWHLLYWLSYLLIKFTHLAVLVPLQNESSWPYLWIYSLVTLINVLCTGLLGQHELLQQRPFWLQLKRLLLILLPLWLAMVVLRQTLVMQYATTMLQEVDSVLKYFVAFSLVLLPLAGWLAVFMLIKANQLHYASVLQQQQLAKKARQARLKVLRYQLNPHFMFNTLNALNALIVQRNGLAAEQLIQHLSTYLRHSLKNQQDEFIPLQQELDALTAYMAIQQVRFGERLQLSWQLPEQPPKVCFPPLLLQPLAENAIQFSVAEVAGDICLQITVQQTGPQLHIRLAQQGASATAGWPNASQPLNLVNLAERLQLLFGSAASLTLSHSNSGFYSQLSIATEALNDCRT